jgi:hypothetical protein
VNLSFVQLLAGSIGALLVYCAIVDKTPAQVIKEAMGQASPAAEKTAYTGAQWGPYNPTGAGLQPNTPPSAYTGQQWGPYNPSGTGLQPPTR